MQIRTQGEGWCRVYKSKTVKHLHKFTDRKSHLKKLTSTAPMLLLINIPNKGPRTRRCRQRGKPIRLWQWWWMWSNDSSYKPMGNGAGNGNGNGNGPQAAQGSPLRKHVSKTVPYQFQWNPTLWPENEIDFTTGPQIFIPVFKGRPNKENFPNILHCHLDRKLQLFTR